jgi:hypothetical protein
LPEGIDGDDRTLADLLSALENAAPMDRMDLREAVLGFGAGCIDPLQGLATRVPDLAASASAWLEVLALRDPGTKPAVVRGLTLIARTESGSIARDALARLGAPQRPPRTGSIKGPRPPSAAQAAVHARIIKAAREGRVLTYTDLETNRGHQGMFLLNISQEESDQGHPPLTSIVVSKTTGRPGDGFLPAMIEIGFAHEGEKLDDVWGRAVAAVHSFWQRQPDGGSQ